MIHRLRIAAEVQVGLIAMLFVGAGIAHFSRPQPYIGIVPPWLPRPDVMVAVSGAAEILGGLGMIFSFSRRAAAIGLMLLLVAIFPANIYMLSHAIATGASPWWQAALWLRLPLQPALMLWVWRRR